MKLMNKTECITILTQHGTIYCAIHIDGLQGKEMYWNIVRNVQYVRLQAKATKLDTLPHKILMTTTIQFMLNL